MNGRDIISQLKTKFSLKTDRQLSDKLGMSVPSIQVWLNRTTVTARQIAELVDRASRTGAANLQANAIRPVVEFFPIKKIESKGGKVWELFSGKSDNGLKHPYLEGLRQELEAHHGVYVFFDSRGQAIYAGKARKQKLWKEMNLAFNRDRKEVQSIRRVKHPERKQAYKTSDEKTRQITQDVVPLHELATYFSAYKVADSMIADLESLLVRSFANDLLNVRMEKFGHQKKSK